MKKLNFGILMALALLFVVSCGKDSMTYDPEFVGVWMLEKVENYDNGDYHISEHPSKTILEFRADGTFRQHLYDDSNGELISYDFDSWNFSKKNNTLNYWQHKEKVIDVNSTRLVLRHETNNSNIYGIFTYRKLSAAECANYGIDTTSGSNTGGSGAAPSSLVGHQISLRMYDGTQYIDAYHNSSTKVTIGNHLIETTDDSPRYTYSLTSSKTADYTLTFIQKVYVPYTDSYSYSFKHYVVTLTFSDGRSGKFKGTIYTGSLTGNPKKVEGIFIIDETEEERAKYEK